MMRLDDVANKILIAAYNEAKHQKHEFFTPEHILYASLFFDEGRDIIENCGGKVGKVDIRIFGKKELLGKFIGKDIRSVIAVLDRGFAKRTIELIDEAKIGCGGEAIGKKESL